MAKKAENDAKKDILNNVKDKVMAELNKEIKASLTSQVNQFKESFQEEITRTINEEVEEVVKREEKRIARSKNFALFKKNVVILILLAITCYFGYCLYDVKYFNFMKSDCEKNGNCMVSNTDDKNSNPTEEVIKDKNWYMENYGYLLNNVQVSLNADQVSAYYLYSKDYVLSDIKVSYLLNLAFKQVDSKNIKENSLNVTVDEEVLKKAFENLFGSLDNYKASTFSYNCLNFQYDKDKKRYVADNKECSSNKKILENITDMYEEDNKLYILTTATIYDENEASFYTFDNLFDAKVTNVTPNDLESNSKKLNKYQYIFKKADDTYYFDSITKLK